MSAMPSLEAEAERKLIVALDVPEAAQAYDFWQRLALPNAIAKIGLELLMAGGVELVRKLASSGVSVFVDAKLFDIANTVERATARVAGLGATFLTVHAQDHASYKCEPGRSEQARDCAFVARSCAAEGGVCGGCRFRRRRLLGVGGTRFEGGVPRSPRFGLSRHPAAI